MWADLWGIGIRSSSMSWLVIINSFESARAAERVNGKGFQSVTKKVLACVTTGLTMLSNHAGNGKGNIKMSDPTITYLKSYGYSTVLLPKADIKPLQIIIKEGSSYSRLGDLATVLNPGKTISIPVVRNDKPTANINGESSSNLSLSVGLTILGNIIGAMGGSKLGLDIAYKNARFVQFEFQDVLEDRIEVAKLDQFLADGEINPNSRYVTQMLEADRVDVITAVIKSKKFKVLSKKSQDTSVNLDVPVIQTAVGGNVKVSAGSSSDSTLTYEGAVPLVFGFQAVRLFYDDGRYTTMRPEAPGGGGLRATPKLEDDKRDHLRTESCFLKLNTP